MSTTVIADVLSASPSATTRLRPLARWRRRIAALGASRPAAVGLAIVLVWIVLAILAPAIAHYAPNASDLTALAHPTPSRAHWLGTDHLGRDIMSRILWGARPVLVVAPLAVLGAAALGCLPGLTAASYAPWLGVAITPAAHTG